MLRWCCGSAGGSAADGQALPVSLLIPAYVWPDPAVYAQLVRLACVEGNPMCRSACVCRCR